MYDILNKTIEYIEVNLKDDISLDDISYESKYSKTHMSRLFNKVVGLSLTEYINRRRLSLAAIMLKDTDKPIEYISDIYRFGSSKYFSTVFKKEFGISPSKYRKESKYVYLYPMRIIKGGNTMNKRNDIELIEYIVQNSNTQDELMDTLSELDNVVLYNQENSEIKLISIIEVKKEEFKDVLVQIELNLISGKHFIRPIFSTVNSPGVKMHSVYKDDDAIRVLFKKSNKSLTAELFPTGETDFEVMIDTNINEVFDSALDEDFPNKHIDVQSFSQKLLGVNNNFELEKIIDDNPDLIKLRSFINEYALIYMTHTEKTLALFSIFLDLEDKRYRQVNVFTTPNKYQNLVFKKEGHNAVIYNEDKMVAKAHIYTRDLSPTYALTFPNGSSGTGAWDLTNMFNKV